MNYQLSPQPFQDILFSEIYVLSFPAVFKRFEKCPKIEISFYLQGLEQNRLTSYQIVISHQLLRQFKSFRFVTILRMVILSLLLVLETGLSIISEKTRELIPTQLTIFQSRLTTYMIICGTRQNLYQ